MSYETILAKSPSIIFRPGGVAGGLVVTTWADVQAFIALRQGTVIVYVDDSIAPAHVPTASGVTDCEGRVEIRPYRQDANNYSTLTVDNGATLKSVLRISGTIFLVCDTQGAVPGLDWDYTPNVLGTPFPTFYVEDFAALGTTATCTQPPIVVPAAESLFLTFNTRANIFMQSVAFLVSLAAATSNVTILVTNSEICSPASPYGNVVTGAGSCTFQYDLMTSNPFLSSVAPVFTVGTLFKQQLDGDTGTSASTTQTVYVRKSGSDAWGNGTRSFPYLTIQKAYNAITDASTNKRYIIDVGVGEYADPFLMKPWVALQGPPNSSEFYGPTEITAPANTVGYDPVAYTGAGFAVAWISNLVFSNQQTWNQTTAGNQRVQLTCKTVDFNGGFQFIGDGSGGVDNYTLDDCLVYGGGLAQGIQFLFTIGGTQFLGGTVTIQSAPVAGAIEKTTWLAQNTAIGSAFNPTNVHLLWAAPTPAGQPSTIDWTNTAQVGTLTLDGANTSAKITGLRPANVVQTNGAPAATTQPLTFTLQFGVTTGNIFGALQAAGQLPTTGTALVLLDGWGGGGGGAGGGISDGAAPGVGGAGGGGATRKSAQVLIDLSQQYNANIGLGGNGGTGANPTGANGNAGGETNFQDVTGTILVAFDGGQGGTAGLANTQNHALTTAVRGVPGAADLVYAPDLPANTTIAPAPGRASPATAPACGGYAQALAADTFAGSGSPSSTLNTQFGGGNGGQNAIGAGTLSLAGGGGGGGPAGAGGKGGDSVAAGNNGNPGISGSASSPNSGAGGGGGSGAPSNLFAGGQGGSGGRGFLSVTIVVQ